MELKALSSKQLLSHSDCVSEPEEKEISDDDDDDRNHKHRRRDSLSQSLERDTSEQVLSRTFRKRNNPFDNGYFSRESDSQSSESWKSFSNAPSEKSMSIKLEKRHFRTPLDPNQRKRINQSFSGDVGPCKGRGKDSGTCNHPASRFNSVDIASQIIHHNPVPPSMFLGNVSNAQSASWGTFGLLPGMPNGSLDIHPLSLQGTLRPPINPSLNICFPRQQCRDFEELGFCLRGEMCPMEHGVNRIVVEDVQSLSQFNLPVSVPNAHILGTAALPVPRALPAVSAPSSTLMNSKGLHNKSSNPGTAEDGLSLNGAFPSSAGGAGADLYDPDQPLWNNDCPERSIGLHLLNSPKTDETEPFLDADPSDHHHDRFCENTVNEQLGTSAATAVVEHGTIWGRMGSSRNKIESKKKFGFSKNNLNYIENKAVEDQESLSAQGKMHQRKDIIAEDTDSNANDFSLRMLTNGRHSIRKPSQQALCTLFVSGIPHKNNRRDTLLLHFRKFGEVIDIYIPVNSEQAFVQFSKPEDAEAALVAPDAVMGNRFIRLWWANRDNIPVDTVSNGAIIASRGLTTALPASHSSVSNSSKDGIQPEVLKVVIGHASAVSSDQLNPVGMNSLKAPPPLQKKLENLELLKEELRKKQEMLDEKRNDFRRQLYKLEKATGLKGEASVGHSAKKQKVESAADFSRKVAPATADSAITVASEKAELTLGKKQLGETVIKRSPKIVSTIALEEPPIFNQEIRPLVSVGTPSPSNRFKLDNRPTAFRIIPPLPSGLSDVTVLKEHFAPYGDLSMVDLEDSEAIDGANALDTSKKCSARITFATRQSAERAFANGKCWKGHTLQLMWHRSSNANSACINEEKSSSTSDILSDAGVHPVGKVECIVKKEATDLENGSTEERISALEQMERHKAFHSTSTPISCEELLPKDNLKTLIMGGSCQGLEYNLKNNCCTELKIFVFFRNQDMFCSRCSVI